MIAKTCLEIFDEGCLIPERHARQREYDKTI